VEGRPFRFFYDTNVEGTRNVIAAAAKHEVARVIHASTTGVYGVLKDLPASEDHPYGFTDHYQDTKIQGERIAKEFFNGPLRDRGVVVRPTGMYGPGDTRILKLVRAIKRGYFFFPGPCENLYHPTYIEDALDAFELVMTRDAALGQTYNLAGLQYLPLREYIRTISSLVGVPEPRVQAPLWPLKAAARACGSLGRVLRVEPPIYPRRLGFFYFDRAFSIAKARRELGYEPRVDVGEGLSRTIAWWRDQALL
jgi:nucleoside-diphosphate-sugar epimerase